MRYANSDKGLGIVLTPPHITELFAEIAQVKSEPKASSSEVFLLHEGAKVFLHESIENWVKIELTDGSEGWIENSAVRSVK